MTSLRAALKKIGAEGIDPCAAERLALHKLQAGLEVAEKGDSFEDAHGHPHQIKPNPAKAAELKSQISKAEAKLKACVEAHPQGRDIRIPSGFSGPRPTTVQKLVQACAPPQMGAWSNPERAVAENHDWNEELNGIVTDGKAWYASCNANDEREGLYKLTMSFGFVKKLNHGFDPDAVHIGALAVRGGSLYVPMQGEGFWGVWVVDTGLTSGRHLPAHDRPDDDLFAWCDVNPHNNLLYTCNFTFPSTLYAYRLASDRLERVPKQDIPLHSAPQPDDKPTTSVQGGCFTPNFKWLAVCDVDGHERIHCHSTLTGALLDRRMLLANTDESTIETRNELEAIWYAPMKTGQGNLVQVHVLELNNEAHTEDDMYLWQFSLPDPAVL